MVMDMSRRAALNTIKQGMELDEQLGDNVSMTTSTDRTVTVISMIDGEPRTILANDFERAMLKRLPDGRPSFWIEGMPGDPPPTPTAGVLRCFLYPEYEDDQNRGFDRAFVDSIGLAGRTCNMGNTAANNRADFKTTFQRDAHERGRHRDERATLDAALAERERLTEREERRQDRAAMLALSGGTPEAGKLYACVKCDDEFDTKHGLLIHDGRAHKES